MRGMWMLAKVLDVGSETTRATGINSLGPQMWIAKPLRRDLNREDLFVQTPTWSQAACDRERQQRKQ